MRLAETRNIVIVGASSGIGESLARKLARPDRCIALVARRMDKLDIIASEINAKHSSEVALPFFCDVTDHAGIPKLVDRIASQMGGIDAIIYASGVMSRIEPTEYSTGDDIEMIQVNVAGAVAWLNAVSKRFQIANKGIVVGISSVAADRGRRGNPVYGATKAFFDTYLEGLRNRLERFGCMVITVKPGPIDTPMTQGLGRLPLMISSDEAALQIISAIERGQRVVYVPAKWKPIMTVIRLVPSAIFKRLNI